MHKNFDPSSNAYSMISEKSLKMIESLIFLAVKYLYISDLSNPEKYFRHREKPYSWAV